MNGKFLSDCEITSYMLDKHVILTRGGGEDYKISFKDLVDNLKKTVLREYLYSKIGNIHINTNNKYRDSVKYNDGYIEYLMLNGQEISRAEYPALFKELEIEEEKYRLPNYWQEEGGCTLKHVKEGSSRSLNSYEQDTIKEHLHPLNLNLETETFDIDLNHEHNIKIYGEIWGGIGCNDISDSGVLKFIASSRAHIALNSNVNAFLFTAFKLDVNQNTNESSKKRSDPINVKVKPYKGFTGLIGHKETTGKNVAVQCYIAAKVIV